MLNFVNLSGPMKRILCKTFLSDMTPLCRYSKYIARMSVYEVIPADPDIYINHCMLNSSDYKNIIKKKRISAIRQRSDLMFADIEFDFDQIYNFKSDIAWDLLQTTAGEIEDGATPSLFYMQYSCVKDYSYKVISLQSNDNITTKTTVYVESVAGIIKNWEVRSNSPDLVQEAKPIETMNRLCKFCLSQKSHFYIGGPGTQFNANYSEYDAKIFINSTTEGMKNFTILPGVVNNLRRHHVHTGNASIYKLQYQINKSDTEINFVLPIGGKCLCFHN